jgi:hypothetical protein
MKSLNIDYTDNNRAKVQIRLYQLINERYIEKIAQLHTRSNVYMKRSPDLHGAKFEPRRCLKCDEPLQADDLHNNLNARVCLKCSNTLTTTSTKVTPAVTSTTEDLERLTTSMRNEIIVMSEKLNELPNVSKILTTVNNGIEMLQQQNLNLIKLFAANCRTVPENVKEIIDRTNQINQTGESAHANNQ